MKPTLFDKIQTSRPVNKQAALSSSRGDDYVPAKIVTNLEWETPPRLRQLVNAQADLAGRRRGRLVAVGVLDAEKTSKHNRSTWVCRCDCGRYTGRTAKSLNNPHNNDDRCSLCRHTKYLRHRGKRISNPTLKDDR